MSKVEKDSSACLSREIRSVRKLPNPSPSPGEKYFTCDSAACRYVALTFATALRTPSTLLVWRRVHIICHSRFNLLQFHLSLVRTEILDGDTQVVCRLGRPIRGMLGSVGRTAIGHTDSRHIAHPRLFIYFPSGSVFATNTNTNHPPPQPPCYSSFSQHYTDVQRCGKWNETYSDVIQQSAVTYVSYRGGAATQKREIWPKCSQLRQQVISSISESIEAT